MKLLLLTSQLPYPPHSGGQLRTIGLITGLTEAGHRVDLLTLAEPGQAAAAGSPLHERCAQIVTVPMPRRRLRDRLRDLLLSTAPDMARRFRSAEYEHALRDLLHQNTYDIIQVEGLEMAGYLPTARAKAPKSRLVYDAYNAEYSLQRLMYQVDSRQPRRLVGALYSWIQARRLMRFERSICRLANHVISVSDKDAEALLQLTPEASISIVPNGIYAAEYARAPEQLNLGLAALVFTGSMDYRPNVDAALWFAEQVFPEVREAVPEARFFIVGNRPHARLENVRLRPGVELTGYVPDVLPFLHGAAVYVAPLRMGSGTRLKLLQAMAAGCAIVSTTVGALGLDVASGQEIMLADDATTFAQRTVALLRDPAHRAELGARAQALVQRRYDWSVIVPRLLDTYRGICRG